jgi:excisionase family DNA binding protein
LLLKTPIQYIRKMIREQKIIAYKIGKQYVIKEQDLNNYLDSVKYER